MKIIILGPAHPFRGGIADTNESLCRSLILQGHEASIITFTTQYPSFLFPGKTQFSTDPAPKDLTIVRAISSVNPASWLSVAQRINKMQPDLVIARYWMPFFAPSFGTIMRRLNKGIVKIAMCDNVIPHEHRIGDVQLTKYFLNSFDGFITLSKTTFAELDDFSNKPKTYYPHPINTNLGEKIKKSDARVHLDLDTDKKYLLFFGLIRDYKGLDLTLEALADARLKDMKVHLLVVGEFYEPREKYDAIIEAKELQARVHIVDQFIPASDIKYYFSAADLVIQTYKTASQSGVSQMAFHFDCPILVTDVGGLSEVILHEEIGYVSDKNPTAIANYIYDFFEHNRAGEFIANLQLEKQKYSWEAFSGALFELYEKLKK